MKNVIFLVIDSLSSWILDKLDKGIKQPPFLTNLKSMSIYADNVFSQAPYTEAALISLLCGYNTLDNGGYLRRFADAPVTLLELFSKNGYDVFHQTQPHIHPSSVRRGISAFSLNDGVDFQTLWNYRLNYYSQLLKENKLDTYDLKDIVFLLDDYFNFWPEFFDSLDNGHFLTSLIKDCSEKYDCEKNKILLACERAKYEINKFGYVNSLLLNPAESNLFRIDKLLQNCKVKSSEFKEWFTVNYKKTFVDIYNTNKQYNLSNGKLSINKLNELCLDIFTNRNIRSIKTLYHYFYNFKESCFDSDVFLRINKNYDEFKTAPCILDHFYHFINWLDSKNSKKPFFAYIHVDDIHSPENFFSYSSNEKQLIKREMESISSIIKNVSPKYCGAMSYDLALQYIDQKIETIFTVLNKKGILDHSYFIITSDHGYSYYYNPIRETLVNSDYLENYSIPLWIYEKNLKARKINKLCTSKDIPKTICTLCGIKVPESFTGIDILNDSQRNEVVPLENVYGGGCPDLRRRKLILGAYDGRWLLTYKVDLRQKFENGEVVSFYSIVNDHNQLKNLSRKYSKYSESNFLLNHIYLRYKALKN